MGSEEIFSRFHTNHGEFVRLENDGSVAYRATSYSGLVFSEKHLHPGELFIIEVEQYEVGWRGSLRIGLTQVNPSTFSSRHVQMPKEGFPDLMRFGATWLYAFTDLINVALPDDDEAVDADDDADGTGPPWPRVGRVDEIGISEDRIETCWGSYSRHTLKSLNPSDVVTDLAVGLKIGVLYIPTDDKVADLYYVINGDIYGPYAINVPYKEYPLFAVVDIYGKTKRIRRLQIQARKTLKELCRMIILNTYDMENIHKLQLPKSVIDYLDRKSNT